MRVENELRILANKLDHIKENKDTLKKKEIWDLQCEVETKLIEILNKGNICE